MRKTILVGMVFLILLISSVSAITEITGEMINTTGNITTSGRIGIGTTTPDTDLTLGDDGGGNRELRLYSSTGGKYGIVTATNIGYYIYGYGDQMYVGTSTANALNLVTNNTARVKIESGGNVGIGTPNPSQALHINSSGDTRVIIEGAPNQDAGLEFDGDRQWQIQNDGDASIGTADYFHIRDDTAGKNRITIDTSGNVGIGTSSPNALLEIAHADTARIIFNETGSALIWRITQFNDDFYIDPDGGDANLYFRDDGNTVNMQINTVSNEVYFPNGNVGIGNVDPNSTLDVLGNATIRGKVDVSDSLRVGSAGEPSHTLDVDGTVFMRFNSVSSILGIRQDNDGIGGITIQNSSGTSKIKFIPEGDSYFLGNVGIGTTNPDGTLHIMTADASVSAHANMDDLVIENDGAAGLSVLTPNNVIGYMAFGDPEDSFTAGIEYSHSTDKMTFQVNNSDSVVIDGVGNVGIGADPSNFTSGISTKLIVGDGTGREGIIIYSGNDTFSEINFADGGGADEWRGFIRYNHATDELQFATSSTIILEMESDGDFDFKGGDLTTTGIITGDGSGLTNISKVANATWADNASGVYCSQISGATSDLCTLIDTGGESYAGDDIFLYNDTTTMYLNETKLNATIDDRDSDTIYDDSDVRGSIGTNVSNHEDTYKHGNTTAEIQGVKSDNATHSDTSSVAYDLSGTDVIGGTEIDESSLGIVPNATWANNASGVYCSQISGATSNLCTLTAGGGNSSWNESYASSLYYTQAKVDNDTIIRTSNTSWVTDNVDLSTYLQNGTDANFTRVIVDNHPSGYNAFLSYSRGGGGSGFYVFGNGTSEFMVMEWVEDYIGQIRSNSDLGLFAPGNILITYPGSDIVPGFSGSTLGNSSDRFDGIYIENNISMKSPNGNVWNCGVDNSGTFSCS